MSNHARKRLIRDFRKLQTDPPHGVSGAPVANDIMRWNAVIFGPEDTPWEGGTFQLEIIFSNEYPNRPPVVRFLSKLFHPNVYNDGNICLDILQTQWSPIYDISAILTSIQSLLSDPNPSSPANQEAARLYAENRREYHRRVQQCVNESWAGVPIEAGGGGEKKRGAALAAAPSAETSENERRRGAEEGGGASSSSSSAAPAAAVGTAASSSSSSSSSSSTTAPPSASSSTSIPPQPSAEGGEAARNDAFTRERNTAEEATDSSATQEAAAVPPTPSTAGGVD